MVRRLNFLKIVLIVLCGITCFAERLDQTREIVFPRLLESRSSSDELVLVINKEHTLKLRRSTVFSDNVMIKTHDHNEPIRNFISGEDLNKQFFHDSDKMASVFLSQGKTLQVEGVLSATHGIKPLHEHEHASEGSETPHVIYALHQATVPEHSDHRSIPLYENLRLESEDIFNIEERAGNPSKPSAKDTVYPEIYLVVDPDFQPILGSEKKALQYFGAGLNSVNLMMRSVKAPRVQMRLCGLEFAPSEIQTVFHKLNGSTSLIDDNATLYAFASYVEADLEYINYTLIYLITPKDLAAEDPQVGRKVLGIAFLGTLCTKFRVGLYEDDGKYSGIPVLAHELGHSLGCPHDGYNSSISGAPGSTQCNWTDGYIMGSGIHPQNKYSYSECCVLNMHYVLNMSRSQCAKQKRCRHHREAALPGELTDASEFCAQKIYLGKHLIYEDIFNGTERCLVTCRTEVDSKGYYTYWNYTALDGTDCDSTGGIHKVCVKGNCTQRPKLLPETTTPVNWRG